MEVFGNIVPVQIFNDHDRLIALRPSYYAKGRAEQEAHYLWLEYVKNWFPDEYAKIPNGTSFSPLTHDKLCDFFCLTDGQWHWPIIEFNCDLEDDEDVYGYGDEDLEVFEDQNSDPLVDGSDSEQSISGSQ